MSYEKPELMDVGPAVSYVLTSGISKNPIAPDNQNCADAMNGYCPADFDD